MGKPSQEVVAARKALYESYNRSGLTVDKYCAKFRVSKNDLQYAIRLHRWRKPKDTVKGIFKEIPIQLNNNQQLSVTLRNGLQLQIPQSRLDPQFIVQLIGALEQC